MRTDKISLATLLLAVAAPISGQTAKQAPVAKPIKVIQGAIQMITGSILSVQWAATQSPNSRQVDISGAAFEDSSGKVIPKPAFAVGDRILVVVDPASPETYRPPSVPGRPHPMFIRLLPLKALVVERLSSPIPNPRVREVTGKG